MPRGRLLRSKIKEWYWQAKKSWQAKFQAQEEYYKNNPHAFWRSIVAGVLKNVDPIEVAAIIGSTIIVHEVIFKLGEFTTSIATIEQYLPTNSMWIANIIGAATGQGEEQSKKIVEGFQGSALWLWLIAFAIAYFAVKHGADLLNVAKSMFGVGAVANPA